MLNLQSNPEEPPVPTYRHRFNYFACFIDAVGFPFGSCFFSPVTILPAFIKKMSANSVWIGLTNAIHSSFFFFPQLLAASWIERMPIKRGYVLTLALIERFAILVLVPQIFIAFAPSEFAATACWFQFFTWVHNARARSQRAERP